jgi:hypothetical protein
VVQAVAQVIHLLDHSVQQAQEIHLQLLLLKVIAVVRQLVTIEAWAAEAVHLLRVAQELLAHKAQAERVQLIHIQAHL